jgi:hypothetical protein
MNAIISGVSVLGSTVSQSNGTREASPPVFGDLTTMSVQDLASAFASARAFAALASAKVTADRAVARTQTLAFISLIGR